MPKASSLKADFCGFMGVIMAKQPPYQTPSTCLQTMAKIDQRGRSDMNTTCATIETYAKGVSQASDDRHRAPVAPCVSHEISAAETSIKSKWGGSRSGSGGARIGTGGPQPGSGRPRKVQPVIAILPDRFPMWCAVSTYYGAEQSASRELARSGYRAYMPAQAVMKRDKVTPTMLHRVIVPRITGYLFVELVSPQWAPLLYIPGINKPLLSSRGFPSRVPNIEISRWMADDATHLNFDRVAMPALVAGCRVEVISGAMAGYFGTVTECDGTNTTVDVGLFGGIVQALTLRASVKEVVA